MFLLAVSLLLGVSLTSVGNHAGTLPVLDSTYRQLNHVNIQLTDAFCLTLVDSWYPCRLWYPGGRTLTSPFQMRLSFLDCPLLLFLEQKMNIDWQDLP